MKEDKKEDKKHIAKIYTWIGELMQVVDHYFSKLEEALKFSERHTETHKHEKHYIKIYNEHGEFVHFHKHECEHEHEHHHHHYA